MNQKSLFKSLVGGLLLIGATMLTAPQAQATTLAGTQVFNKVRVDYQSLGGATYHDEAEVTVTVNLVRVAPVLVFVSQEEVASSGSPTDELLLVTQTWSITNKSNGPIEHYIAVAIYTPSDIDAADPVSPATTIWLGAATVGYPAASGQPVIYVTRDVSAGATDSAIGGANGIVAGDRIIIGSTEYEVQEVDNSATAASSLPAGFDAKLAKLTLAGNLGADLIPGDQIGEIQDFEIALTTGELDEGKVTGYYDSSLTVHAGDSDAFVSTTKTTTDFAASRVHVARCNLTITKQVHDGTGYVDTADMDPAQELLYRIVVTENSTNTKVCKTIKVTDALSPYVAFRVGSIDFTAGGSGLLFGAPDSTTTYVDQANAAYADPTSEAGGAPANYDANVSGWTVDFGTQQMNAGSSFQLDYRVWLY